jgi:hypothetical protein
MASDNPFSVNLPPVQWMSASPSREGSSEPQQDRAKKSKKAGERTTKSSGTRNSAPFEEAAPHEVDSFA